MALTSSQIEQLYDQHASELLLFLHRRTRDPELAVDLLAETFARAFLERAHVRKGGGSEVGWLFAIARNLLYDSLRAGGAELRAVERLGIHVRGLSNDEYQRIEELGASAELRAHVASELRALPRDQGAAIRLRVIEERSYPEVARALGVSEQTARARVSRGLRALRESSTLADLKETADHASP